jgi:hypothetical protein
VSTILNKIQAQLGGIDRDTISTAIGMLRRTSFFPILVEHTLITNNNRPANLTIDMAALRGSWMDGYLAAVDDVKNFVEKYILEQERKEQMLPDFGAVEKLIQENVIKNKSEI